MQFGKRVRELRKKKGLLQRQLAAELEIDTPMFSKIERGERKAKRKHVSQIAKLLDIDSNELLTLWLADQVYEIIKNETLATEALKVAEQEIKYRKKSQ